MSIRIQKLGNEHGEQTSAFIIHGEHQFEAFVHGKRAELAPRVNQECMVEMTFERVVSWRELPEFDDAQACIKQSAEVAGAIALQARVHNIVERGNDEPLIDLYLQTGPEFLAISSDNLDGKVPAVGAGLEVTLVGLCFWLT